MGKAIEYITKEKAIEAVVRAKLPDRTADGVPIANGKRSVTDCVQRIKAVPAADVAPVRHGRWIDTYGDSWKCSACGAESYVDEDWHGKDDKAYQMNYCHYCGAKMDGGGE